MLVLPAEAPDTGLTRCLEDGDLDRLAVNPPLAALTVSRRDGEQSAVVDRLHETVSERVERGAQCVDVLRNRYVLLRLRHHGPVIED